MKYRRSLPCPHCGTTVEGYTGTRIECPNCEKPREKSLAVMRLHGIEHTLQRNFLEIDGKAMQCQSCGHKTKNEKKIKKAKCPCSNGVSCKCGEKLYTHEAITAELRCGEQVIMADELTSILREIKEKGYMVYGVNFEEKV